MIETALALPNGIITARDEVAICTCRGPGHLLIGPITCILFNTGHFRLLDSLEEVHINLFSHLTFPAQISTQLFNRFRRRMELIGISTENVKQYVENYFTKSVVSSHSELEPTTSSVEEMRDLKDIARFVSSPIVPLIEIVHSIVFLVTEQELVC